MSQQQVDFQIPLQLAKTFGIFFHSQYFGTPPYPTQSFANKVVIVTGSNVGLGLEAARHFYRLGCAKLILAVRTISKGQSAKESIVKSVKHRTDADAIEVWELDLGSTASTLAFAENVNQKLERVDIVVENAGINTTSWVLNEGFESTIQVNVVNTLLLALKILPKLRETSSKHPGEPTNLVIVSSEVHRFSTFKELNGPNIYDTLNEDKKPFDGFARYSVSKLMEVLFVRELVSRLNSISKAPGKQPDVIIDLVNPGLCYSNLIRDASNAQQLFMSVLMPLIARTTEVGSRTFVHAASADASSHGEFMSDGKNQDVEAWIYTDLGKTAQKKVFEQSMEVLESRSPGIGKANGL